MKTETELKELIESLEQELFNLRKSKIKVLYDNTKNVWLADFYRETYYYLTDISSVLNVDPLSCFTYVKVQKLGEKLLIETEADHFATYEGEKFGDGFISFCSYAKVTDKKQLAALDNLLAGYLSFKQDIFNLAQAGKF
jgi:hypothetical protein